MEKDVPGRGAGCIGPKVGESQWREGAEAERGWGESQVE